MRNHGESLLLVWKNKRRRDGGDDNAGRVVMLGDFQERIAHLFVGCLQFFNRLFNRGDEILLAITSHLGVHAVAFATVRKEQKKESMCVSDVCVKKRDQ